MGIDDIGHPTLQPQSPERALRLPDSGRLRDVLIADHCHIEPVSPNLGEPVLDLPSFRASRVQLEIRSSKPCSLNSKERRWRLRQTRRRSSLMVKPSAWSPGSFVGGLSGAP